MQVFVALLRGINVGGNNILPMQDLRDLLAGLDCADVATYIQSGNAVFRHSGNAAQLCASIADGIESDFGFRPAVMVIAAQSFAGIAAANPYSDVADDPKQVHITFLGSPAVSANLGRLEGLASGGEEFILKDSAFYLYAPNGIGRSKLAAAVEKCLGVATTSRNARTVSKIGELLDRLA
jgi:uncharacterized protein (DUF1697 family)